MLFSRFCVVLFVAAMLAVPVGAQAALISANSDYGPDTITFDTATGLAWLDVTYAQGRTYNDVSSKTGIGQEFEGFHHATQSELQGLFANAGISNMTGGTSAANFSPATALQALVGMTHSGGLTPANWTTGIAGFSASAGTHKLSSLRIFTQTPEAQVYLANGGNAGDGSSNASWGHWLVSEQPVSVEPKTWSRIKALFQAL